MKHNFPDVIEALSQRSDVNALDREGRTPLFYAVLDGDSAIAAQLIGNGANVNAQDRRLETPLHFAARAYQPKLAKLLLNNGATVDSRDDNGNSPLFRAIFESQGRGEMIELLLAFGADRYMKNKHGVSAEDLAKSIHNYDVERYLAK